MLRVLDLPQIGVNALSGLQIRVHAQYGLQIGVHAQYGLHQIGAHAPQRYAMTKGPSWK